MLIVEDGTGLADADSYCSREFADAFLAARGLTLWAGMLEDERDQALRRATEHMLRVYRRRWLGYRATTTQALDWPRVDVPMADAAVVDGVVPEYPEGTVPAVVQQACAALAFKAAFGDLAPDDGGQRVKRETIGPITTEYEFVVKKLPAIDGLLAPLLGTPSAIRIVRA